jgi:SAM-dependent methyltransferase
LTAARRRRAHRALVSGRRLEFAEGERAPERWWSDDQFWDDMFDFIFPPEHLALGEELAAKAAALLGVERGAAILDLGCGPGRVAVPLARRGFRVTGVDAHAGYLERARAWAEREGVELSLCRADMSKLTFHSEFDAALCVFNSFGYFDDPGSDQAVLERARQALRPGGRFLLEVAHRDGIARTVHVREARAADGRRFREEPRFDLVSGLLEARWTLDSPRGTRTFVSRMRPYTATQLGEMLRRAGFRDVRFQRDLDGGEPSLDSFMLVALATAPP